jgi:hypothetical protein
MPDSMKELEALIHTNSEITGFGVDVENHIACPFCGAKGFMTIAIINPDKGMEEGGDCKECGRSAKALVQRSGGSVRFEMVQTGGPDLPSWYQPPMRRVEPDAA